MQKRCCSFTTKSASNAETDLAGSSIQLIQALDRAALAVGDPVAGEVTKEDGLIAGTDERHVVRSFVLVAQQSVGLTRLQTRLPEELTVTLFLALLLSAIMSTAACAQIALPDGTYAMPARVAAST